MKFEFGTFIWLKPLEAVMLEAKPWFFTVPARLVTLAAAA